MRRISDSLAVRHPGRACIGSKISLLCAISLFFALPLDPQRASADPELSLSWSAKELLPGCPDRAWAMTRIEREIKRAPTADVSEGVHAIVAIERRGSGYLLSLHSTVGTERGERTIEGADCHELAEAAILIIALSVSEADDARARNAEAAAPDGRREDEEATEAPGPEPERQAQAERVGFFLRPEFVLELGVLKRRPTLGPELALGVEWGHYRAELAGIWLIGETSAKGREIALRLAAARVRGCALFGAGRARGGPCVGLELGDALGSSKTQSGVKNHTFWAASSLAARLAVALGFRLSLVLDAEMMASWGQLKFLGANEAMRRTPVLASQWVQLRTHLGLEISF